MTLIRPLLVPTQIVLAETVEIDERLSADGEIVTELDTEAARRDLTAAYERGLRSIAIVLMHGYRFPAHEQQLAALARRIGFSQVSVSHEVSPLMKLVSRGDTTVVDAYLSLAAKAFNPSFPLALIAIISSDNNSLVKK